MTETSLEGPRIIVEDSDRVGESRTIISDAHSVLEMPHTSPVAQKLRQGLRPIQNSTRQDSTQFSQARIIPEFITYSLSLSFDDESLEIPEVVEQIAFDEIRSYERIEEDAENCLRARLVDRQTEPLFFCRGKCLLASDLRADHCYTLSSQADWKIVFSDIVKLHATNFQEHIQESFHLNVSREYVALPTGDKSLASITRNQIHFLMKTGFDGRRRYIPNIDLQRIMTTETIEKLIFENPPRGMNEAERKVFVQRVQQSAPKLLAMCIYAQLGIECLKTLLDKGLSDSTSSIDDTTGHRCHSDHRVAFTNLVNY